MQSFLKDTVQILFQRERPLSDYTLVVPSKRAGGFLRQVLVDTTEENFFSPTILSIEEFVVNISGLEQLSKTNLLLESYRVYSKMKDEPFESYLSWVEPILNDFSEIDRHLVSQKEFFDSLSGIKLLETWGLSEEETPMIKDYISFWESIHEFYINLTESLLKQQKGYQGMIYRKAVEEVEFYIEKAKEVPHAFIGFNALNKAEQTLIQELLEHGNAEVFWDMDPYFVEDTHHGASHFYRHYIENWKWYNQNTKPQLTSHFEETKSIEIVEAQSDIEQVKYIGSLLSKYSEAQLSKTAIVLADEALLIPLIHSLPENVTQVNVTMGYPLNAIPAAQFFMQWLEHSSKYRSSLYYKNLYKILNHPVGQLLMPSANIALKEMTDKNRTHISLDGLIEISPKQNAYILKLLFQASADDPSTILNNSIALLNLLLENTAIGLMERMVFQKLWTLFQEIKQLQEEQNFLKSNEALKQLFEIMLHSESLDMEGDAYKGLQIMGMLETRVLDFENILMLSVNEGTLPTGKSHSSYLTYDLKSQFELPMHTEKDAIYAYHFFRLLQRCSQATLVYNSASSGLSSGEKSRFLLQLEIEKPPKHNIAFTALQQTAEVPVKNLMTFSKTELAQKRLRSIAKKGFSPSALTAYIRNPKDFYYQRILGIKELEEVEETVAYNTLGTIVHEALEFLYQDMVGHSISPSALQKVKKQGDSVVEEQFIKNYGLENYKKGQNLIIFEVAKRYVQKLIEWDLQSLQEGHEIELISLETKLTIPLDGLDLGFPVSLHGMVDRIDRFDGGLRIIDYKTGKVEASKLKITDWGVLLDDYDYSKAFQVLAYAYMLHKEKPFDRAQAGIISFKAMNNGFMPFKDGNRKQDFVDLEVLKTFEEYLFKLIREICDPSVPFIEKGIMEKSW